MPEQLGVFPRIQTILSSLNQVLLSFNSSTFSLIMSNFSFSVLSSHSTDYHWSPYYCATDLIFIMTCLQSLFILCQGFLSLREHLAMSHARDKLLTSNG